MEPKCPEGTLVGRLSGDLGPIPGEDLGRPLWAEDDPRGGPMGGAWILTSSWTSDDVLSLLARPLSLRWSWRREPRCVGGS